MIIYIIFDLLCLNSKLIRILQHIQKNVISYPFDVVQTHAIIHLLILYFLCKFILRFQLIKINIWDCIIKNTKNKYQVKNNKVFSSILWTRELKLKILPIFILLEHFSLSIFNFFPLLPLLIEIILLDPKFYDFFYMRLYWVAS